jgi:transcriptional regulator with XRE-family HTH domain
MLKFDPKQLKRLRIRKKITASSLAKQMEVSPAQVHRLENGDRRLTVDALFSYCRALGIAPGHFLVANVWVPIVGAIQSDFEVHPLASNTSERILAPPMTDQMDTLAALRWEPTRRFAPMRDHIAFFNQHNEGIPKHAWNQRCLIRRADDTRCLGWPIKQGKDVHIDTSDGQVEFNAEIRWASPILSVMPPWVLEQLQAPPE